LRQCQVFKYGRKRLAIIGVKTGDELGEVLRAIGWTSAELARRLTIRPDTVNSWLTGRRPVPANVERWLYQVRAGFGSAPALPDGWRTDGAC
jgi:hypothetical protein